MLSYHNESVAEKVTKIKAFQITYRVNIEGFKILFVWCERSLAYYFKAIL